MVRRADVKGTVTQNRTKKYWYAKLPPSIGPGTLRDAKTGLTIHYPSNAAGRKALDYAIGAHGDPNNSLNLSPQGPVATVADIVNAYIVSPGVIRTADSYASVARRHILNKPIAKASARDTTAKDIRTFLTALTRAGVGLSQRNQAKTVLSGSFGDWVEDAPRGEHRYNPVIAMRSRGGRKDKHEVAEEQASKSEPVVLGWAGLAVGFATITYLADLVALNILLFCGLRWAELASLRPGNVIRNAEGEPVVLVAKVRIEPRSKGAGWGTEPPKRGRSGQVACPEPLWLALRAFADARIAVTGDPDCWLWPGYNRQHQLTGLPRGNGSFHLGVWKKVRLAAGYPHAVVKDLRSTSASLCQDAGATVGEIQEHLRHKPGSTVTIESYLCNIPTSEADPDRVALRGSGLTFPGRLAAMYDIWATKYPAAVAFRPLLDHSFERPARREAVKTPEALTG